MSEEEHSAHSPWHSKRWLVVGVLFFAVASMLVVGITVAAQLAWQSSPEKALLDAADYSSKTPATYQVEMQDIRATISYDGTRQAVTGTYKTVPFSAVVDGSTLYIKSTSPAQFVQLFTPKNLSPKIMPAIDMVVAKVTGRWLSIPLDQLPFASGSEVQNMSCALTARSQLTTDKDATKELASLYSENKFLAFNKQTTTDKSIAYSIGISNDKFDTFVQQLKKSSTYDSLKSDCANAVQSAVNLKKNGEVTADILLSKSKHALQSLQLKGVYDKPITVNVTYGDVGTITVPTDALSYDAISSSIVQTMIRSYLNNR